MSRWVAAASRKCRVPERAAILTRENRQSRETSSVGENSMERMVKDHQVGSPEVRGLIGSILFIADTTTERGNN